MKLKSLLFGSAAAFATVTGAQAADLPIAEPVEYVRICDAFGAGYYYIPGTETCLKIGGYVRVEARYVNFNPEFEDDFDDALDYDLDDTYNQFTTYARANIKFDARTQTGMGILRSYISLNTTVSGSSSLTSESGDFAEVQSALDDALDYSSTSQSLDEAYIQLIMDAGTITMGHASSNFDFWGTGAMASIIGPDDPTTEATQFAYTFAFGSGFSATIAIEDARSAGRMSNGVLATLGYDFDDYYYVDFGDTFGYLFNANYSESFSAGGYAGQKVPDLVANLRLDQGWGSVQLSGALRYMDYFSDGDGYFAYASGEDVGLYGYIDEGDDLGWAVQLGLEVGIPNTAFTFDLEAGYARGAIAYVTSDPGGFGDFNDVVDDVTYFGGEDFGIDYSRELTEAWRIAAGVEAGFSDSVVFGLYGSYTHVDRGGTPIDFEVESDDFPGGFDTVNATVYASEYDAWGAAAKVAWTPVSGLTFTTEVDYTHLEYDFDTDLDLADFDDIGEFDLDVDSSDEYDVDVWSVVFRAQRTF